MELSLILVLKIRSSFVTILTLQSLQCGLFSFCDVFDCIDIIDGISMFTANTCVNDQVNVFARSCWSLVAHDVIELCLVTRSMVLSMAFDLKKAHPRPQVSQDGSPGSQL